MQRLKFKRLYAENTNNNNNTLGITRRHRVENLQL